MAHKSTILVVDDERPDRDLLEAALSKEDYDLAFASSGLDALAKAAELTPDLILLDVMMPGMDGFEVCQRLRADPLLAEVPIVMVTALTDRQSRLRGVEAGADDFISKPFEPTELRARVGTITRLNRYRLLLEQAKFERLIEVSPDGLIIADAAGMIRLANPTILRMLGVEREEDVKGKQVLAFIAPEQADRCSACLRDAIAGTEVTQIEAWFVRPSGGRFPAEINAGHFVWNGEPAAQIVVRDITKRKQAEMSLRESEAKWRSLAENVPDTILMVDREGKVLFTNRTAQDITSEQAIGRRIYEYIPAEQQDLTRKSIEQVFQTGDGVNFEIRVARPDGTAAWYSTRLGPIRRGDKTIAVVLISTDITERKHYEQFLQYRNLELATRNAVAQALSSSIELKEMLDEALSRTVRALGFVGGLIALVDERTGDLTLFSYISLPLPFIERLEAQGLNNTLCEFVYQAKRPLSLEDLRKGAPLDASGLLEVGLQSCVGAPIICKDRSLGIFCLFDTVPHPIFENDYGLLLIIGQQIGVAVENARLFEDITHEREVAQTLLDTAEVLSVTLQLDKLLEHILDGLKRVVPYDVASISMLRDERWWHVASRGLGHVPTTGFALEEHPLVQQVVHERGPIAISDIRDEPNWSPPFSLSPSSRKTEGRVRSWLGVPLISMDEVIGVLMVSSHHVDTYDEEAARLTFAFAHQASLAIENSRMYGQTRARLRETNLLYDVIAALSSTLDLNQILPYVAHTLCQALNGTSAEIYSLDEEASTITVIADYVASEAIEVEKERRSDLGQTYALDGFPATAEALTQRHPVQMQMDDPDAGTHEQAELETSGAKAGLLLPMITSDRVLGLAKVWDSQGTRRFTRGEIALGQTLANQAAIAMENARLFAETQKSVRQTRSLYETSRAFSSSLDEESLMYTILESVYRFLGCDYVFISTVDEEAGTIGVRHSMWHWEFDIFPEWVQMDPYSLDHSCILADVYRTGHTEIIGEWDERFDRDLWDKFDHERLLRIFIPIKMRDQVAGVVEIGYDKSKRDHITEDEMQMLAAFVDQAAVALENARLFEETQRRVRGLRLLHDVGLAAASGLRLEDTLQAAAEALAAELEGTHVGLALLDSVSNTLHLEANAGSLSHAVENMHFRLGEGVAGWVAQHSEPAFVSDVRLDPRYIETIPDMRSELCVPLTVGPTVIGVLNVESPQPNAFTNDEQQLLSTLANNLAALVERARLFEEVEEANVRLQELDRLKSQFLANMSHELRTPLNSIIGFSDALLEGVVGEMPPEQRGCVQDILSSGEHLLALISEILDLSKIEAGRMTLEPTTFDVAELLAEVRATIMPLTEKESQVLMIRQADNVPPLTADRFRVKQVLLNLLSNAHKFTPAGGHITLFCRLADPATVLFSVVDSGIGIKPEDQEVIFEEFRQVDGSPTRMIEGTGLGLAISKRLVEMHGGRIWVESEYGHGANFSILLPLVGWQSPESAADGKTEMPSEGKSVLVVEDDRQFSNLLTLYLRQEGYTPVQHYSGMGVLERARKLRPALITLDIILPDQDGWDVLRVLKSDSQTKDIPVLVISVLENSELALSLGAVDYLVKPVRRDDLVTLFKRMVTPDSSERKGKVLVVDDDREMIALLGKMLPAKSGTLLPAYCGEEGLRLARSEHPDVILLNLLMSGMNGFEVLEELRADAEIADIPVIVLTAKDVTEDERELLHAHIQGVMRKETLTPQSLLVELRRLEALRR
ncbi:MAG: response regulator [Chloroflexota bacterium]|nr:response regulator [Chloroflexota bacterium]